MNRRLTPAILAFIVLTLGTRDLAATVLLPADFTQMTNESQVIVHGRVLEVRGELVRGRRSIESVITIAVLSPLKGTVAGELAFRVPGGTVGRYRRVFVGAPVFKSGDEVVLFLKGRAPSMPVPFGLNQGVFRVSRATGVAMVLPVPATEAVAGTPRGDAARKPLPLAEFSHHVRMAMQGRP